MNAKLWLCDGGLIVMKLLAIHLSKVLVGLLNSRP